jgi:class 3 adenylate cyclase
MAKSGRQHEFDDIVLSGTPPPATLSRRNSHPAIELDDLDSDQMMTPTQERPQSTELHLDMNKIATQNGLQSINSAMPIQVSTENHHPQPQRGFGFFKRGHSQQKGSFHIPAQLKRLGSSKVWAAVAHSLFEQARPVPGFDDNVDSGRTAVPLIESETANKLLATDSTDVKRTRDGLTFITSELENTFQRYYHLHYGDTRSYMKARTFFVVQCLIAIVVMPGELDWLVIIFPVLAFALAALSVYVSERRKIESAKAVAVGNAAVILPMFSAVIFCAVTDLVNNPTLVELLITVVVTAAVYCHRMRPWAVLYSLVLPALIATCVWMPQTNYNSQIVGWQIFRGLVVGIAMLLLMCNASIVLERSIRQRYLLIIRSRAERENTTKLLLTLLPQSVVRSLRNGPCNTTEQHPSISIMFVEICDFDANLKHAPPKLCVELLNRVFNVFDDIVATTTAYKVESVKATYLVATNLIQRDHEHVALLVDIAKKLSRAVEDRRLPTSTNDSTAIKLRIGIHTGQVIAGVIERTIPRFRLIGDTVNTASRMCTTCPPNHLQISKNSQQELAEYGYDHLALIQKHQKFICPKGKGEMETYCVPMTLLHAEEDAHELAKITGAGSGAGAGGAGGGGMFPHPMEAIKRGMQRASLLASVREREPMLKTSAPMPEQTMTPEKSMPETRMRRTSSGLWGESCRYVAVEPQNQPDGEGGAPFLLGTIADASSYASTPTAPVKKPPVMPNAMKSFESSSGSFSGIHCDTSAPTVQKSTNSINGWFEQKHKEEDSAFKKAGASLQNVHGSPDSFGTPTRNLPATRWESFRLSDITAIQHNQYHMSTNELEIPSKLSAHTDASKTTMSWVTLRFDSPEGMEKAFCEATNQTSTIHCKRILQISIATGLLLIILLLGANTWGTCSKDVTPLFLVCGSIALTNIFVLALSKRMVGRPPNLQRIAIILTTLCATLTVSGTITPMDDPYVGLCDLEITPSGGVHAMIVILAMISTGCALSFVHATVTILSCAGIYIFSTNHAGVEADWLLVTCVIVVCAFMYAKERAFREDFIAQLQVYVEKRAYYNVACNLLPPQVVAKMCFDNSNVESSTTTLGRINTDVAFWSQNNDVAIMYADIAGFTSLSSHAKPEEVVALLRAMFKEFDKVAKECGVRKIDTIGDCYWAAANLPSPSDNSGDDAIYGIAKFAMLIHQISAKFDAPNAPTRGIKMRVGIAYGTVCTGVVGRMSPRYHVFGPIDTEANAMEQKADIGGTMVTPEFSIRLQEVIKKNSFPKLKLTRVDTECINSPLHLTPMPWDEYSPFSSPPIDEVNVDQVSPVATLPPSLLEHGMENHDAGSLWGDVLGIVDQVVVTEEDATQADASSIRTNSPDDQRPRSMSTPAFPSERLAQMRPEPIEVAANL